MRCTAKSAACYVQCTQIDIPGNSEHGQTEVLLQVIS